MKTHFPAVDEDIEVRLDADNRMMINLVDYVSYHIYMRGYYEPDTVKVLKSMLRPGMTFVDIGAHFGQYTLVASAALGKDGVVHAFEPGVEQLRYLRHNISINDRENVRVNAVALGSESGTIEFAVAPKANLGGSHIATEGVDSIRVPVERLDDYCDRECVKRIDILKIDVEGAEKFVFEGGRRVFVESPPSVVFYECIDSLCQRFGYPAMAIHDFLRSMGYRIMKSTRRGLQKVEMPPPPEVQDFVAVRD
jgi:FkbM family methyltransferase